MARLPAVMAKPCSVQDQIAMSTVASACVNNTGRLLRKQYDLHRKSGLLKFLTYGKRTTTAALALSVDVRGFLIGLQGTDTYMQAIAIIGNKAILLLLLMFNLQMTTMGSIANVKSQMTLHTLYRYVSAMMISMLTQEPF